MAAMFKNKIAGSTLAKGKNALCYDKENLVNLLSVSITVQTNQYLTVDIFGGITGVLTESNSALVDAFGNENISYPCADFFGNVRTLDIHKKVIFLSLPNGTGKQWYNLFGFSPDGKVYAGKSRNGFVRCSDKKVYGLNPNDKRFDPLPENVKLCRIFGATSSNTRRKNCFAVLVKGGDIYCPNKRFFKKMNHLMRGAAALAAEKEKPFNKAAKDVSRLALSLSPSMVIGKITELGFRYAIYMGKLNINGVEGCDGGAQLGNSMVKTMLSNVYGRKVTTYEAYGFNLQFRTLGIGKGFAPTVADHAINTAISDIERYYSAEVVEIESPTKHIVDELNDGSYDGKLIIVGPKSGKIGAVMDLNCIKLIPDIRNDAELRVLDSAKLSRAKMNVQIGLGYAHVPGFIELLTEIAKKDVRHKIERALNKECKYPVSLDAVMSGHISESLIQANPKLARKLHPILSTSLENLAKTLKNSLENLSFEVEGWYQRLVGDPGIIFGRQRILKDKEVYSKAFRSRSQVVVNRNPKIGTQDHFCATVVGWKTIKARVRKLKIDRASKLAILSCFKHLSPALMVLPCTDEVKCLLGGQDYDYDGATVISSNSSIGKKFNELARKVKEQPVNIIGGDPSGKKKPNKKFSVDFYLEIFTRTVDSPNADIGRICVFQMLMLELANSDDKTLCRWLKAMNIGKGTEEYRPLSNWDIDVAKIAEYERHIKNCNLLKEDGTYDLDKVREIIRTDWSNVMISVCGNTLDAVKELMYVLVPLFKEYKSCKTKFYAALRHRKFDFALDKETWTFKVKDYFNNYDPLIDQIFVESKLSKMQQEIAAFIVDELNKVSTPEDLAQEEFEEMFDVVDMNREQAAILASYRLTYFDAMRLQMQAVSKEKDFNFQSLKKENDSDFQSFKEIRDLIAKSVRSLTTLTPEERGAIALYLSTVDKNNELKGSHTSFFKCFADEVLAFALPKCGAQKYCGVEVVLNSNKGIGKYITFNQGISKHAISIGGKINGKFRIAKYEDKVFAVRPIKDVIEEKLAATADGNTIVLNVSGYTPNNIGIECGDLLYISSIYNAKIRRFFSTLNKVEDKVYGGVLHATKVANKAGGEPTISLYGKSFASSLNKKLVKVNTMYRSETITRDGTTKKVTLLSCDFIERTGKVRFFGTKEIAKNEKAQEILTLSSDNVTKPTEYPQSVNISAYTERAAH